MASNVHYDAIRNAKAEILVFANRGYLFSRGLVRDDVAWVVSDKFVLSVTREHHLVGHL